MYYKVHFRPQVGDDEKNVSGKNTESGIHPFQF